MARDLARAPLVLLPLLGHAAAAKLTRGGFLAAGCAASLGAGVECYSRWPTWDRGRLPRLGLGAEALDELVVVLPGAGGPDANTARIVASLRKTAGPGARVVEYDWKDYVGDQLQAPYNAQRLGDFLAEELRPLALRKLHVVGISVGAFAADRLVERVAASGPRPRTRLTLLDPFTARGALGLLRPSTAYGVRRFGREADVAECVLNTDDPVPSTSTPLRHAANFDVTNVASRAAFTPLAGDSLHSWPAAWFGMNPTALDGAPPPRGELAVLR